MEALANGSSSQRYSNCIGQPQGGEGDPSDSNAEHKNGSPTLAPPYWLHRRHESYASIVDNKPAPITLEDHTEGPSEQEGAVWAKGVYIEDHVVVSGNITHVGDFVVWNCRIDTIDGSTMIVRRRYSEFFDLRERLLMTFPGSGGAMPPFPPKSLICKQSSRLPWARGISPG